jgi:hypothetical protein
VASRRSIETIFQRSMKSRTTTWVMTCFTTNNTRNVIHFLL